MTFLIDNTWSAGDCELAAAAGAKDGWGEGQRRALSQRFHHHRLYSYCEQTLGQLMIVH